MLQKKAFICFSKSKKMATRTHIHAQYTLIVHKLKTMIIHIGIHKQSSQKNISKIERHQGKKLLQKSTSHLWSSFFFCLCSALCIHFYFMCKSLENQSKTKDVCNSFHEFLFNRKKNRRDKKWGKNYVAKSLKTI